jgi:nicotinate-nucleotide adenylyltransferase
MSQSNSPDQQVAFFGGSFDPPHLGHLAVAHAAVAALSLDMVLFAPVGSQPLKPAGLTASFEDRVEMTRLAIEGESAFKLSLVDAPRPGGKPNYTLDSLLAVKSNLPPGAKLCCLMGADSFAGLRQWFCAAQIPFVAPLIVASRPGQPLHDLAALLPLGLALEADRGKEMGQAGANPESVVQRFSLVNQAGRRAPFYLLPDLDIPISATMIREAIRVPASAGIAVADRGLVPEAVAQYIRSRELYR